MRRLAFRRVHARLRQRPAAQRFTLLCRTLLALGFVAPGLVKLAGDAFVGLTPPPGTPLDEMPPMLAFFLAFQGTGAYYAFVGVAQAAAAVLLLSRRTALLGALLYLPVIANVAVLTVATGFGPVLGTQLVTVLMLLACVWLVIWDAHRLAPVVVRGAVRVPSLTEEPAVWDLLVPLRTPSASVRWTLRAAWVAGFAGAMGALLLVRGPHALAGLRGFLGPAAVAVLGGAALALVGWGLWARERRAGRSELVGEGA